MSNELKPCPFCASEAIMDRFTHNQWFAYCRDCCAESGHFDCQAEAIDAWNRRATVLLGIAAGNNVGPLTEEEFALLRVHREERQFYDWWDRQGFANVPEAREYAKRAWLARAE